MKLDKTLDKNRSWRQTFQALALISFAIVFIDFGLYLTGTLTNFNGLSLLILLAFMAAGYIWWELSNRF